MTVVVALAAMDFHCQVFPVDIVGGDDFADEHRYLISAPGARIKFVGLIRAILGICRHSFLVGCIVSVKTVPLLVDRIEKR